MILQNQHICIRALEPTDLDFLYQQENHTDNWATGNVHAPLSRYALHHYIQNQPADIYACTHVKWIMALPSGQPIGLIELNDIDHYHQRADVGILIEQNYRQKGYASMALQLLIAYAKNHLGWHQLTALVAQKNTASHGLFQQAGFVQSGKFIGYFRTDKGFEDAIFYQLVL